MNDISIGERDLLTRISPDSLTGALLYLALFALTALILSRGVRATIHASIARHGHIDKTTGSFLQQLTTALIWIGMLILYAHLIPVLRAMGTALLAGAGVASVVIGLAAQSTLGNLIAGIAITLYRPFRLGNTLQVAAPTGTEIGTVELISLGYTTLRTPSGRLIILPNSLAASQVAVNLDGDTKFSPWPLVISGRVSRTANWETVRQLALDVSRDTVGSAALVGCFLVKVEADTVTFELRIRARSDEERETWRSTLLHQLGNRFAEAHVTGESTQSAAFS